jgi:hypothetical protein
MLDLGNPKDRVLPFLLFCACVGLGAYLFVMMGPTWAGTGVAIAAFFAGGLFMMWADRRGL